MCYVTIGEPVAYSRRFWMLFLLILSILVNNVQINEFTALDKTMVRFYRVNDTIVSMSSAAYLLFYLLLFFPAIHYTSKCGLRHAFILGSFLNATGLCVKCFALQPGRFWLVILAQIFPAAGETLITPAIPALAATWFKTNEVATVVAVAFAAIHCGLGITYIFQGTLFQEGADIHFGMDVLSIGLAIFGVLVFVLTMLTMEDRPPSPPSLAQVRKMEEKQDAFKLTEIITDWNYLKISLASGIVSSVNIIVAFLVNQLILTTFPNDYADVTVNGVVLAVSYVIGSLLFGSALDQTKQFRLLSLTTTLAAILSTVLLGVGIINFNKVLILVGITLFGLFTGASISVTTDATIELTYPFPETISISISYCIYCIIPLVVTPVSAALIDIIGAGNTVLMLALLMIPALICLLRVKWVLKRQIAEECLLLLR